MLTWSPARAGLVALLLSLCVAPVARAVIIVTGDGTGNTSAPSDDPGWDNVLMTAPHYNIVGTPARYSPAKAFTATYLGNGWVITAAHVGANDLLLGNDVYRAVPESEVMLQTSIDFGQGPEWKDSDVMLYRIQSDPGLPEVSVASIAPVEGQEVVMIGRGRNRGEAITWNDPETGQDISGWAWGAGTSKRWGTNIIDNNPDTGTPSFAGVVGGSVYTAYFAAGFSEESATQHEAQAAHGDSGGAVFAKNGDTWELVGVLSVRSSFPDQPAQTALYGNESVAADLDYYRDQILDVVGDVACNNGLDEDGDGLVDLDDPGCVDLDDAFERGPDLSCDDGVDNDGDGAADFPDDPGCADPFDDSERDDSLPCDDGVDNDENGLTDHPADPNCWGPADLAEIAPRPPRTCAVSTGSAGPPPHALWLMIAALLGRRRSGKPRQGLTPPEVR